MSTKYCSKCGEENPINSQYCSSCGGQFEILQDIPPIRQQPPSFSQPTGTYAQESPQVQEPYTRDLPQSPYVRPPKDRIVAGILALILGDFGVHKFYLENIAAGLLYLFFFWTGIPAIIGIIEGIIYLTESDEEFQRNHVYPRKI